MDAQCNETNVNLVHRIDNNDNTEIKKKIIIIMGRCTYMQNTHGINRYAVQLAVRRSDVGRYASPEGKTCRRDAKTA